MEHIVSFTPPPAPDPLQHLASPPTEAAVVELRLDLFPGLDMAAAVAACPLPVLATYRSQAEGGRGSDDPEIRARILRTARNAGALLFDLEFCRDLHLVSELALDPGQLVVSWHHTSSTPPDLSRTVMEMMRVPARFIKVVPTAAKLADLGPILDLHRRWNGCRRPQRRLVCFAMGTVGQPTRYLAPVFGPPLSYCAWPGQEPAAPGQLAPAELEAVVGHLGGAPQLLFGVVGEDVSRSFSPRLHSAAYASEGLHHLFLPISVPSPEELSLLFGAGGANLFDRLGVRVGGWAVTSPYKREAVVFATQVAPRAERAGAANTLLFRGAQVVADTTDADGVVGSLVSAGLDPAGRRVLVYGAGGAARGAAVGLHLAGADVELCGRRPAQVEAVAHEIGVGFTPVVDAAQSPQILVNASALGSSAEDPSPFAASQVADAQAVVDMVYAAHSTALVELAVAHGVPAVDGRKVLAYQGFAQFAAMTGAIPPRQEMLEALGIKD